MNLSGLRGLMTGRTAVSEGAQAELAAELSFAQLSGRGGRSRPASMMLLGVVREMSALNLSLAEASMAGAQKATLQRQRIFEVVQMEQQIREAAARSGKHSRETAESTQTVAEKTELGHQILEKTTQSMHEMVETVAASAKMMSEFVSRMAEVNRMVQAISRIAHQTNLLALNAAIEAAHAGREGDGFSVIAQEIRVLADQARDSTTEISEKIGAMTASARVAATAMQAGDVAARSSIEQNLEVQRSFRSIRDAMQKVKGMSAEVADGSDRQMAAVELVANGLEDVDALAAECTLEADASAEMSIRLISRTTTLVKAIGEFYPDIKRHERGERASEQRQSMAELLEDRGKIVEQALQFLNQYAVDTGACAVIGATEIGGKRYPGLCFGTKAAVDATDWTDEVHRRTGCSATVFVRSGESFVRAATNVKRTDGKRATGTLLNPKGLAIKSLRAGKSHRGAAYVLGKPFYGAYEPLTSASGEVVGAFYVGRAVAHGS